MPDLHRDETAAHTLPCGVAHPCQRVPVDLKCRNAINVEPGPGAGGSC